jgi:cobalt/nickel transport system permease protein
MIGGFMHIPDGYLAPQTTIPVFVGMIPLWGLALHNAKKVLLNKQIPTLSLCAAFSFVIMMFNVPVAGGSSAHAVGSALVAILFGPWPAFIAVSVALLIQALVFADGGILSFGVNCFNMAFMMPFAAYFIYKLISGKAAPGSTRSLAAAFVAAYAGINLAAFLTAVELGIQPLLFTGSDGNPLYCPYPLSISIPAMMAVHLSVAGLLEAFVTSGALAYLSKTSSSLFIRDMPDDLTGIAAAEEAHATTNKKMSFFRRYRTMLIPLLILVIFTPLGLLATGTAWGEWGPEELQQILGFIPQGFAKIADQYHAFLPDYTLPFGNEESGILQVSGYIISALFGMTIIAALIMASSRIIMRQKK